MMDDDELRAWALDHIAKHFPDPAKRPWWIGSGIQLAEYAPRDVPATPACPECRLHTTHRPRCTQARIRPVRNR